MRKDLLTVLSRYASGGTIKLSELPANKVPVCRRYVRNARIRLAAAVFSNVQSGSLILKSDNPDENNAASKPNSDSRQDASTRCSSRASRRPARFASWNVERNPLARCSPATGNEHSAD